MDNRITAPGGAYQINPLPGQGNHLTIQPQPPSGKFTTFPELLEGKLPTHLQVDPELVDTIQDQEDGKVAWTPEMMDQAQGLLPSLTPDPEGFFHSPSQGEALDEA